MRYVILLAVLLSATIANGQTAEPAETPQPGGWFANLQMLWFDSEYNPDFELAPRIVFGYDDVVGARVRYWSYDQASHYSRPIIGASTGVEREHRLDFDVIDLEALTHIRWDYSDLLLSGGARIAHIDYNRFQVNRSPVDDDIVENSFNNFAKGDLGGVTFAAEGRTNLVATLAAVYGGRLSVLDGNWTSYSPLPDETTIVTEAFAGIEARYGWAFTRMTVELQNWDGRARAGVNDTPAGGHDYAFTGYGFDVGVVY